jgi:two-component system, chemotaxis family, response regulator Rcp1
MSHALQRERPLELLLVEDNAGDARLLQEVLKDIALPTTLHVLEDGQPALAFLRKQRAYAQASTPDLVLLDVFLPVLLGREVFVAMKQEVSLAQIPVCLFVQDPHDPILVQLQDHGLQVPHILTKPVQTEPLMEILRTLPC